MSPTPTGNTCFVCISLKVEIWVSLSSGWVSGFCFITSYVLLKKQNPSLEIFITLKIPIMMDKTPNLVTRVWFYSLFSCHLWSAFQLRANASTSCQKKSKKSWYLLDLVPQVFQVDASLPLPSNKVVAQGPVIFFSPHFHCWLYLHYWNFAHFFSYLFFSFLFNSFWPIFCMWSFYLQKTILTFVGIQVNWGFWLEHSNHCNLKIARLRVTFKQKVQRFQFSGILKKEFKPRESTGKFIFLLPSSRESWFDILWEQHILTNRDHNLLY